jgi:hypothetical protein
LLKVGVAEEEARGELIYAFEELGMVLLDEM